jgi:hypothetical protein
MRDKTVVFYTALTLLNSADNSIQTELMKQKSLFETPATKRLNAISSKNNPIIAQAAQNRKDWELL